MSGGRGMSGERRKRKMKLLRDILEEQVRIREAGGVDEVKKIVSRLRKGGALSEAEVRRIEKAGYDVAEILRELDAKVKRDFPEVHDSEPYNNWKKATASGRKITFQAIREENEEEVLAEAGVSMETYESFIEKIRIGSSSKREALLEEFETYGDDAYRVLADRLVNEGIMNAMDIPGLTPAEVNVMEQIDDVVEMVRGEGLTAMPMPALPPGSAKEADLEMFMAMEDVSEEATVEEEVRDPFQDDAAMGTTLSIAMEEAETEIRRELAAEFIAQIPLGADMAGEPQSAPTPQLESEIERVSETRLVRTESGTEELKAVEGVGEGKTGEPRERTVLRPGGRTEKLSREVKDATKGIAIDLFKEVVGGLRQEAAEMALSEEQAPPRPPTPPRSTLNPHVQPYYSFDAQRQLYGDRGR
jgi:hypothetical protein